MLSWQPLRIEVVVGYTFDLLSEAIFYLLRTFLTVANVYEHHFEKIVHPLHGCHSNNIIMLPWQPITLPRQPSIK